MNGNFWCYIGVCGSVNNGLGDFICEFFYFGYRDIGYRDIGNGDICFGEISDNVFDYSYVNEICLCGVLLL